MNLKFRTLKASEIEVRVRQVNRGGVSLVLYQDARAAQDLLDETVGCLNWQKRYLRDNANCVVSIFDPDKNIWVEKEDTGTASNTDPEKGLASDSFKRACVNWGIGRELYSSPKIFIKKEDLPHYSADGGKFSCGDEFSVKEIEYGNDNTIVSVTVGVNYYGKESGAITFKNAVTETVKQKLAENDERQNLINQILLLTEAAATTQERIEAWVKKQFGCSMSDASKEQLKKTLACLKRQAGENN